MDLITENQYKAAGKQASTVELLKALGSIFGAHKSVGSGLALNPSATQEQLSELESLIGAPLPKEARTLWEWHNGEGSDCFMWYHKFISIEESIEICKYNISDNERLLNDGVEGLWNNRWVPLFETDGEWYCVECGEKTIGASPVVFFFIDDAPSVAYTCVTSYMQTIAMSMENGAMFWEGKMWGASTKALALAHKQFNAEIDFPYAVERQTLLEWFAGVMSKFSFRKND